MDLTGPTSKEREGRWKGRKGYGGGRRMGRVERKWE